MVAPSRPGGELLAQLVVLVGGDVTARQAPVEDLASCGFRCRAAAAAELREQPSERPGDQREDDQHAEDREDPAPRAHVAAPTHHRRSPPRSQSGRRSITPSAPVAMRPTRWTGVMLMAGPFIGCV